MVPGRLATSSAVASSMVPLGAAGDVARREQDRWGGRLGDDFGGLQGRLGLLQAGYRNRGYDEGKNAKRERTTGLRSHVGPYR